MTIADNRRSLDLPAINLAPGASIVIAAPLPGESIQRHFDADGTLLAVVITAVPSPGFAERGETSFVSHEVTGEEPDAVEPQLVEPAGTDVANEPNQVAWLTLAVAGGVALAATAGLRTVALVRRRPTPDVPSRGGR